MAGKRKTCPVNQRQILDLCNFDKYDNKTYDGTETIRKLNKFERNWFEVNSVSIVSTSKSFYGRTFVVPYIDINNTRYWIVDKEKERRNCKLLRLYGARASFLKGWN